jgi:putative acyl-CoA dehydrogenase
VTKRSVAGIGEALECLGGNGYAEESGMPRLFRESPVNAVWEGSGNVQALDLLRVLSREPHTVDALRTELAQAAGTHPDYDRAVADLTTLVGQVAADPGGAQRQARVLAGRIAVLLQGSLVLRYSPAEVADAFVASRVTSRPGADLGLFGALPTEVKTEAVVARATPQPVRGG